MERYFNTAGPNQPRKNYTVDPFRRIDWAPLQRLVDRERYFILHAPRQTGKTTLLNAIVERLKKEGSYEAHYFTVEAAKVYPDDLAKGVDTIISRLISTAEYDLPESWVAQHGKEFASTRDPGTKLVDVLARWAANSRKPIVLMVDEIDSLVGGTLVSVLSQLRDGYCSRPRPFPHSVMLCGVRDVRDYRISTANGEVFTGTSCFNIKAESLKLGNFSEAEVRDLYGQHTAETGQEFCDEVFGKLMALTGGQPWLVNAIAHQLTEGNDRLLDRTVSIGLEDLNDAKEGLIRRCDTHLDQLAHILHDPRVRKVMAPLICGDGCSDAPPEDVKYVAELGLIVVSSDASPRIANEIYREVIPRSLATGASNGLADTVRRDDHILPDGRLDFRLMLGRFQQFFMENSEIWEKRVAYEEAAPQLLLQAWLQRVINGGEVSRQFGLGTGLVDIFAIHRYNSDGKRKEQRFIVEIKMVRSKRSVETTISEGLVQIAKYIERTNPQEAHLVVFNPHLTKWDERVFVQERVFDGHNVTVWGM